MKKIMKKMLTTYYNIPFHLAKLLRIDKQTILSFFCKSYNDLNDEYCMVNLRPKKIDGVGEVLTDTDTSVGEFSIVVQGQIESEFVIESVKIYKKIFPKAVIIVSTWDYTEEKYIRDLEQLGVVVLKNKLPDICGLGNVNYQICSTYSGLLAAKERKIKYVIKTRTDQRIYEPFAYEYMKSMMSMSKRIGNDPKILTVNGFDGQLYAPYWLQDFVYFGKIDDVIEFFDVEYDNRNYHKRIDYMKSINKMDVNLYDVVKMDVPEVYLTRMYLLKHGIELDYSINSWWEILKKYFVVINRSDIKLYWNKYNCWSEYEAEAYYDGKQTYAQDKLYIGTQIYMSLINDHLLYNDKMDNYNKKKIKR